MVTELLCPQIPPQLPTACPTWQPLGLGQVHEGPPPLLPMQPPPNPTHPPVPRLRSVKIEQGKLNDQANTLADLAKVSKAGPGWGLPWTVWAAWVPREKGDIQ